MTLQDWCSLINQVWALWDQKQYFQLLTEFADWVEEQGLGYEAGVRWQVEHNKRPDVAIPDEAPKTACWCEGWRSWYADLPPGAVARLSSGKCGMEPNSLWKYYLTAADAVIDAARVMSDVEFSRGFGEMTVASATA